MDTPNSLVDGSYIFTDDISDEELEIAAGPENGVVARVTLAACTGVWSTFCNS